MITETNAPRTISEPAVAPSALTDGLDVKAELIVFERICTDLLSIDQKSRPRILLAVSQLLGLRM